MSIYIYSRINNVWEGKEGETEGGKRGGKGEYVGTPESGRKQMRQQFLAIAALGLAAWQVTDGGGGGKGGVKWQLLCDQVPTLIYWEHLS